MGLKLTFLGGAGTVTGSKYLLEHGGFRILVDCGLFQGYKPLRLKNWAPFPVPPSSLSAVVLTHAHLDHSGYLPLLVRNGFRGPVFCTAATKDLCSILLPDSGHLQEQDAAYANRHGFSRHHPALPLYSEENARRALDFLRPVDFDTPIALPGGAEARFVYAGHILGAASVLLRWAGRNIAFSGDIGRFGDPLMRDPQTPSNADFVLIESTYGNRSHDTADVATILGELVGKTVHRGGTVVVPAFAVGRAQSLLYHLSRARGLGKMPSLVPIFLDSPMAIDATEIFRHNATDQKLRPTELARLNSDVQYVRTSEESRALTANPMPKVILSASGMATGGRVLHHLEHYAPDPKNMILFTGFQAGGTRGAAMVAGVDSIKMHGVYVPVRAEVRALSMLSAHADRNELLRWAGGFKTPPRTAYIVHGEPEGSDMLRRALEENLGWSAMIPEHGQEVMLP